MGDTMPDPVKSDPVFSIKADLAPWVTWEADSETTALRAVQAPNAGAGE